MVLPGLLAVGMPIVVGLVFRFVRRLDCTTCGRRGRRLAGRLGLLMVGTIGGILLATVLNNSGGAWDNAKKFIESGEHEGRQTATSSARALTTHAAAVVGDTVGDPFKDTAGPSLHVLIKLLARSRWCWRRCSSRNTTRQFVSSERAVARPPSLLLSLTLAAARPSPTGEGLRTCRLCAESF